MRTELPLARLAEALRAEHGIDIQAALQVIFNLRIFPLQTVTFAGLQTVPFDFDHGIAGFDLSLDISETADGLSSCSSMILLYLTARPSHGSCDTFRLCWKGL